MTEKQIEQWSVGIKSAIAAGLFLVAQAIAGTTFILGMKGELRDEINDSQETLTRALTASNTQIAALTQQVATVQENQAAGAQRAVDRQRDLETRIEQVITIGRDRNASLDARVRPLETQAAAQAATLTAINQNLVSLGSEFRDLRNALMEEPQTKARTR